MRGFSVERWHDPVKNVERPFQLQGEECISGGGDVT